ncbi:glycosyltransferase family 4 protein [Geomonas propionica]|uniref:Glycosyltransferase family 4 protein n=1 Tax=Geomonas propionica TaxID=2798582 RepID=A0ABS0YVG6_9BACT|nr:glycosyltransferase family 4 protein [Geomonas propionica]MBJ6801941.1 glycosyltransferase family 4 protein [Geomonas propionica]
MQIWLINPYGPIPSESWRDYCFTMMADALAAAGHEVVWWTSNFSHHFKKFRSEGWQDVEVRPGVVLRLVPTTSYRKNIGLGRAVRDLVFGVRAYRRGRELPAPDCIIFSESPLTFGYAGYMLARHHNCPVIYHQMDLWPELIEKAFPNWMQPFMRLLFTPVYLNRKLIYGKLDAVLALARPYLDVPLTEAPVLRGRPNGIIYNGIDVAKFRESMRSLQLPAGMLPEKEPGEVRAVFAGSLGPSYDILALIKVAERLEGSTSKLRVVIAGDGPLRQEVERYVRDPNHTRLCYVGKLSPEMLAPLYRVCDIGLCAYSTASNVEMPDKIYDYTAAGLAVVNSLRGEVAEVIKEMGIGLQYRGGDVEDLLGKLTALAEDAPLRQEMAARSFEVGMRYDQHLQYGKLVDVVHQVCAAG